MIWLWAVTAFSAGTAAVTGLGWAVTAARLSTLRWNVEQERIAAERKSAFHSCPVHRDTGLYNAAEPHQRVDLTDISRRNLNMYQNRTD